MKKVLSVMILAAFVALNLSATQPEGVEAAAQPQAPAGQALPRFVAYDLFLDPHKQALAAYQIEVTSGDGPITTLVGIEGGDGAYADAPYYDPEALHPGVLSDPAAAHDSNAQPRPAERVILAALASDPAAAPSTDSRIARLHYMLEGSGEPSLSARLIVAGADERTPINADLRLVPVPIESP